MRNTPVWMLLTLAMLIVSACAAAQPTEALISVQIEADGQTKMVQTPAGSAVEQALALAQVELGTLDRTEPEGYTLLAEQSVVRVIRVVESFEVQQETIPYERQTLYNESLAVDQEVLIQKGQNGLKEITYRRVSENGVETSSQPVPVKSVLLQAPLPEIIMLGIQTPFTPVNLPGRLVFLRDGNVWAIEGSSANRRAVLTTGDLDGRVFSLSDDGNWLLFTRRSEESGQINRLWAADLNQTSSAEGVSARMIDLKVDNVVHFADWTPGSNTRIVFSTVEVRTSAPGWQANNDLHALIFSPSGWTTKWDTVLDASSGGVYGWWGTDFIWNPDGSRLAFTRPDGVGLVDFNQGLVTNTLSITPFSTRGDWAWTPGLAWSTAGDTLIAVDHPTPPGSTLPEESQQFDLTVTDLNGSIRKTLATQSGMFAYPLASPVSAPPQIAFLQAYFPAQSESSGYQLAIIDQDGANLRLLFPAQGAESLEPQKHWGAWSPQPMPDTQTYALAVLYQGNLWLVDAQSGAAVQITGDHLTYRVAWKQLNP